MNERIPEGWEEVSLSEMAGIDSTSLKNTTPPDYEFHYIDIASVSTGKISILPDKIKFSESPSRARRIIKTGDVLMSTVRPNLKAFAYFENGSGDYICSTGFSVLRAKGGNSGRFIFNSILSDDISKQIDALVVGSNYPAISSSDVKNLLILQPTAKEQQKIASILTSVDTVIEKTEAQIKKLKDLKKAMMQELLTKGIGHTEFKDSPVGRIPRSWEVNELKYYLSFISYGFTNPMPESDNGYFMVTAKDIFDGEINLQTCRRTTSKAYQELLTDKSRPKVNDILLTKDGSLGRVALVKREGICINQSVAVLRPNDKVIPKLLQYLLESPLYQKQMIENAGGSTIKHIYITIVDKMAIALPDDSSEQQKLLDVFHSLDDNFRLTVSKYEAIKSLKKALMQDLLTGKVRVKV